MAQWLPPPDYTHAPWTGYTRAHWEAAADHLLAAVAPHASPDFAQFRLPGRTSWSGETSDGLEGFARTFLLAAFRIAGAGGEVAPELVERYAAGLAAGTDPHHPHAWPAITDRSQPIVEAASLALALHETRRWIFDALDDGARERVVTWLSGVIGAAVPQCNWVLFPVVVQQFLANVGGPHEPAEITAGLERIEDWYVGDGWYTDGDGQNYDYYAGWALHLYPLLWARMAGTAEARRLADERYRPRLRRFLDDYQHFFAADGAPVHQGRSLTYRFATAAPLWVGALADATPLPPGRTRRVASGTLRHFVEHGAPDADGLLRLGWHHEYLPVTQPYSGPASPYWASKGFLGLLLPPEHPVWAEREEPAPVDTADRTLALPGPGWLLHSTADDGIVRLVNHGSDHAPPPSANAPDRGADPHYVKLGYASHTAPVTGTDSAPRPGSEWGALAPSDALDGQLTVLAPDGTASRRRRIGRIGIGERFAVSAYTDRVAGVELTVQTASILLGRWELRVHRVADVPAGFAFREGGYAVADTEPPVWEGERATVHNEELASCSEQIEIASGLVRTSTGLTSRVSSVFGWGTAGVRRAKDAHAFGRHAATPYLAWPYEWGPADVIGYAGRYDGGTFFAASAVALSAAPLTFEHPTPVHMCVSNSTVPGISTMNVTCRDRDEEITVRLGSAPAVIVTRAGERVIAWSGD